MGWRHSCSSTFGGSQTRTRPVIRFCSGGTGGSFATISIRPPTLGWMLVSPNHAARASGSVIAAHTASTGYGRCRTKVMVARSPSIAKDPLRSFMAVLFAAAAVSRVAVGLCKMAFQGVQVRSPVAAVPAQPLIDLRQAVRAQRVDPPLGIRPDLNQPDLPQHPQVPRHSRLGEVRQRGDQLAGRPLATRQQIQQRAPAGLGHHLKNVHSTSITASIYKVKQIQLPPPPAKGGVIGVSVEIRTDLVPPDTETRITRAARGSGALRSASGLGGLGLPVGVESRARRAGRRGRDSAEWPGGPHPVSPAAAPAGAPGGPSRTALVDRARTARGGRAAAGTGPRADVHRW